MKEMHVLGMDLKDYSVKEAMRMVDGFLQEPKVSTVSFLTEELLLSAQENEKLQGYLASMDLTVPVSSDIIEAADIGSRSRIKEIEEYKFVTELLKKLSDEERTAFVLAETQDDADRLVELIRDTASAIQILGSYSMDKATGDDDQVVNEINAAFVDVVFSSVHSPRQEQFICKHRDKMNASLFLSMREEFASPQENSKLSLRMKQFVKQLIFRLKAANYARKMNKRENA